MPTQKKISSPDKYWINHAAEIAYAIGDPSSPDQKGFYNLLFGKDMELIADVGAFCEAAQPDSSDLIIDDFLYGNAIEQAKSIARAIAYYRLCEEV